ncbi:NAD(P)-dependent oxidoreductase [Geodermatophilus ruber]|uniref:3-hydroxyisobutyrate dehydrogenase n=1 Tax=Geodermatophilus ruber TaxID=504800 RepID=A0A1I4C983_9ACTN|nr:NAD(P)-dependent oxidoreductase [Geodermatophilus ruber]SFK77190.1 3-hydroxyisobutyrate dehydrogenase [Geodermatophilus ruber]
MRIGFIGLGNMGLPMATRLREAGHQVVGTDLVAENRSRLEERGGVATTSAADVAANVDVLILMLPSSDVVESVLADEAVAAALRPGCLVVDMSSSEPLRTRALAERLAAERGVDLVDAPVSGGVKGAVAGKLTIMIGGREELVGRLRPVLEAMGTVVHTGPVASGHALKALNNLMSAAHLLVTSEAVLAGREFGLDPAVMLAAVNGSSGRSGSTENKWPNFILPGTYDSGFALQLMLKDMRIATALATQLGVPSRLGERAVELWALAAQELPAGADHTEIARWLGT